MPFHSYVLENGLQVIGETNPAMRSVAVGFFVRTGSRDETAEVSGVSHFLEHMVFKGTPNRTALEVNRDFDRIGAHYNAFTSEENTVFFAAVLPEYLPQAIDILADILRPSLRNDDFDMEKKVIIEEIGMYDDQPVWSAYDQARRLFFADHPLGNSVLGTKDSVGALTSEQMRNYFKSRYVAPNITVAAAGQFDFPAFVALIEKHCGKWPTGEAARGNLRETVGTGGFQVVFRVPGRVSVATNEGAKSFRIGTATVAPDLLVRAAPALDAAAFLEAGFQHAEEAPLLPGRVALYREHLREILDRKQINVVSAMLKRWCTNVQRSRVKPMREVAKMIREHFDGIVAWTQTRQTNGFIEALNGLFQAAKRKARGYTRFTTMRTVLFLIAGKLDFTKINPNAA